MSDQEAAGSSAVEISQKEQPPSNPPPAGSKLLSASNAIAWSAAVAVLTGFATCAGMARQAGTRAALCLYALARPAIDQRDTYMGMISILDAALASLVVFVLARTVFRLALWIAQKASFRPISLQWLVRGSLVWWLALLLVLADAAFINGRLFTLARQADGIILKNTSDAGRVWTEILLDENLDAAAAYRLIYGACVALFVSVSWWLAGRGFSRPWKKMAFSSWAAAVVILLLLGYSFLTGVTDTIGEFPLVAFSGVEGLPPHSLPILIGSDDKGYALLVVNSQAKADEVKRYVLYVPRSELKWMTVLRLMPLQPLAKLDELKDHP